MPVKTLLSLLITVPFICGHALAASVLVKWDPSPTNLQHADGHRIYYGQTSRADATHRETPGSGPYDAVIDIPGPGVTSYLISDLPPGLWCFRATAYNQEHESPFSDAEPCLTLEEGEVRVLSPSGFSAEPVD